MSASDPQRALQQARVGAIGRLVVGVLLAAGAYLVMRPFLVALAWAAIIAYVSWPAFRRLRDTTHRRQLSAIFFTGAVALGIMVPLTGIVALLAEQATELAKLVQQWVEDGAQLPGWVSGLPLVGSRVTELRETLLLDSGELPSELAGAGRQISTQLVVLAGSVAGNAFTLFTTLLTLYIFFLNGEAITGHTLRWARQLLADDASETLDFVGAVVRSVVFGLVGTALVQGLVAGLGLALFGVPSAAVLGAMTVLLSFIPVGPPIVWGGAVVWLLTQGSVGAAVGMGLWGVFLISSLDNVLRPILISQASDVDVHFLVVFFGVVGGLTVFGLLGLFLGPLLLSLAFALLTGYPTAKQPPV